MSSKKIRYNLSAFFVTPAVPAPAVVVASARLCCLSRVPPAVYPSLLGSTTTVCTSFLQSLSTYVHYIRRRLVPYYDSGPLHKHQIYIRPIFHSLVHENHTEYLFIQTCLMYHAACTFVESQPFKRLYSQLTFFNFLSKHSNVRTTATIPGTCTWYIGTQVPGIPVRSRS